MRRSASRPGGLFITLEGIDGAGKSTQLALLADHLRDRGHRVRVTEEPGGTALGRTVRELLQGDTADPPVARAEVLLFLAARAQHVETLIGPALAAGETVLCSRFSHSTLAYQCHGLGLDEALVRSADAFARNGLLPELVLILDSDPAAAAARRDLSRPADRIERRDDGFHARVRDGFRALAAAEPERVKLVPADGPVAEVQAALREVLAPWL